MNTTDRVRFAILLFLTASMNMGYSQTGQAGRSGLAFLKLGIGARASAMGEAFSSVVDDATAVFWNPAGLSSISNSQLTFTHTEWIEDISHEFLAFALPALSGGVGLSFYANSVGGIERRVGPSPEPIGTIDAHDLAFGLSYGRKFSEVLRGGVSVKYLYEKIFTESTSGFAFDFGLKYQPFDPSVSIALVFQNLGSVNNLREQSVKLPSTVRAGVSHERPLESLGGRLLLSADAVKVVETDLAANFGAELRLKEQVSLRVGYQTGLEERSIGGGFGLVFDRYYLDYGYTPFNSGLGNSHRFSFGLQL